MKTTLKDQISQARQAYLMQLNDPRDGMSNVRYACYLNRGEGMEVLWPSTTESETGWKAEIDAANLYNFKHTNNRKWPAFHFVLGGCGYSKTHQIGQQLRAINPSLEVFTLSGYSPSPVSH